MSWLGDVGAVGAVIAHTDGTRGVILEIHRDGSATIEWSDGLTSVESEEELHFPEDGETEWQKDSTGTWGRVLADGTVEVAK